MQLHSIDHIQFFSSNEPIERSTRATAKSYLTSRGKLQGPKRSLQIRRVILQIEQSTGDRGLHVGRVLPRRRVECDLVDGSHDCRADTGGTGGVAAGVGACFLGFLFCKRESKQKKGGSFVEREGLQSKTDRSKINLAVELRVPCGNRLPGARLCACG